jgi:hypothetical protein
MRISFALRKAANRCSRDRVRRRILLLSHDGKILRRRLLKAKKPDRS